MHSSAPQANVRLGHGHAPGACQALQRGRGGSVHSTLGQLEIRRSLQQLLISFADRA
jgi:hypothetical protein